MDSWSTSGFFSQASSFGHKPLPKSVPPRPRNEDDGFPKDEKDAGAGTAWLMKEWASDTFQSDEPEWAAHGATVAPNYNPRAGEVMTVLHEDSLLAAENFEDDDGGLTPPPVMPVYKPASKTTTSSFDDGRAPLDRLYKEQYAAQFDGEGRWNVDNDESLFLYGNFGAGDRERYYGGGADPVSQGRYGGYGGSSYLPYELGGGGVDGRRAPATYHADQYDEAEYGVEGGVEGPGGDWDEWYRMQVVEDWDQYGAGSSAGTGWEVAGKVGWARDGMDEVFGGGRFRRRR